VGAGQREGIRREGALVGREMKEERGRGGGGGSGGRGADKDRQGGGRAAGGWLGGGKSQS
jgi:hypothetical protein